LAASLRAGGEVGEIQRRELKNKNIIYRYGKILRPPEIFLYSDSPIW
jgi:hypothetical protein